MKKTKQFFKRVTSLVLSLLMLLTPTVNAIALGLDEHEHSHSLEEHDGPVWDGKWHGTTGSLVAQNYDYEELEKAILACTGLVGETFEVQIPTDEKNPGLVSVDASAEKVIALPYETDGQVWTPTKAVIKYTQLDGTPGSDITVPLTEVEDAVKGTMYVGEFDKPANSYHVEVTYSLLITVERSLQELLIRTPYELVDGYGKITSAYSTFTEAMELFGGKLEDLRLLHDGVTYEIKQEDTVVYSYTFGLKDGSKVKEAIGKLLENYDSHNGKFSLEEDCEAYKAAENKLQFMLEHGAAMKEDINFFSEQIVAIHENSHELEALSAELKTIANGPENSEDETVTVKDAHKLLLDEYEKQVTASVDELLGELKKYLADSKDVNPEYKDELDKFWNQLFEENWTEENKQEFVDQAFAKVEEKIAEEIENNKQTIIDEARKIVEDKIAENIETAITTSNEYLDNQAYKELSATNSNLVLSLESLRGKTGKALQDEIDRIKANYEYSQTYFVYQLTAEGRALLAKLAEAMALLFNPKENGVETVDEETLEGAVDTYLALSDEDIFNEAKGEVILRAWREAAKELGVNADKMTLTEAQAAVKTEITNQLNDTDSDLYKEAVKAIKDEIAKQLDDPDSDMYKTAKAEIEKEIRKKAEPLLKEKQDEIDELGEIAKERAAQIDSLLSGDLKFSADAVSQISVKKWHFIGKKYVKDNITTKEYAALEEAVSTASKKMEVEAPNFDVKEKLLAYETVLNGLVSQNMVTVEVKAEVVDKASVDSTALIPLRVYTATLTLDADTPADTITAQVNANGIENTALAQWDAFYNVGVTNYNRTVSIQDKEGKDLGALGNLTQDIHYVITYTPKSVTITENYKEAGSNVTTVPYGYNFTLPRPTEAGKSYDYKVNEVSQREGTVYRVVENITVDRTIGKALDGKGLSQLIAQSAVPGALLSEKEKNVLNTGAFYMDTIYFRTPDSNDKLTQVVSGDGNGYKLEAEPMIAGLLNSAAQWVPETAYPVFESGNGAEFALVKEGNKYVGTFEGDEILLKVQVNYRLVIEGFEAGLISEFASLAHALEADLTYQQNTLNDLYTRLYKNLENLTVGVLGTLKDSVALSPEAAAALNVLTQRCMGEMYSHLYEYLGQYHTSGMIYYYTGDNAEKFIEQINLINEHLPTIWHDQAVKDYIETVPALKEQSGKVEQIITMLQGVYLEPVHELVDTNSEYITNLLNEVRKAGETREYHVSDRAELVTVLSAAAPDQSSYGVTIQVKDKKGAVVETYSDEVFRKQGSKIRPEDFDKIFNELYASVPNTKYYNHNYVKPDGEVTLGQDPIVIVVELTPVTYTVKIDGEADQTLYAFDSYAITLPGTGDIGFKYIYDVNGTKVEVGSGSLANYSLGADIADIENLFGDDRELVITREKIDINRENFLVFVQDLNKAVANAGLLSGNNLELSFIPMKDASGNLSVVLRVSKGNAELDFDAFLAEVMKIVADLNYVGLNGNMLFGLNADNELKLYLQTFVDFATTSGLGLDTLPEIIDENGNLVEMTLPGATVIGADQNNNIVLSGGVINDVDQLGAKLIESTMQYGFSRNSNISVPFYVTLQDFDKKADIFAKLRKGAEQILPYLNLTLDGGKVNVWANAPDSAYAYALTALMVAGQIDFDTIQSYDLAEIADYLKGLIDPIFSDGDIDADTVFNTLKNTGYYHKIERFDPESHKALINTVYKILNYGYKKIELDGSSVGGLYEGTVSFNDLANVISKKEELDPFKNLIAELNTGVKTGVTFHLQNRDTKYEALVLDIRADGIPAKYAMTQDAAAAIARAQDDAIVILLSDIKGDITFNNDVILNLNGYTIDGNLTAKGTALIVDSTLSTDDCGVVTGTLTEKGGAFRIGGGKFVSDISSFLEEGYSQVNGAVTSGFYRLEKNGNEINAYLGTSEPSVDKTSAKVMAADLVAKLVMNFYACSELTLNGDHIYGVDLHNVTDALDTPSVLINKIIDCVDLVGSSNFATTLLNDITNFTALSDSIQNGTPVFSYTLLQSGFNPHLTVEGEGDDNYFAFNVNSSDNKKELKLNLFVSDDVSDAHKDLVTNILLELDKITTVNKLKVDFTEINFLGNKGLNLSSFEIDGNAQADVLFDLTNNANYPVILAAILAKNATGSEREAYVNAIKDYQNSASTASLKTVIEKATLRDLIAALKATKNMTFSSMMSSLGLSSKEAVELEAVYAIARKILGRLASYADITGPDSKLAGLKVEGEYGTYSYKVQKRSSFAQVTLKVFAEEKAIVVKSAEGVVVKISDDLADVLKNVKEGETIYINGKVSLAEDITLPGVAFTIDKAENIDFNGKVLWFDNGNTVLTIDKNIKANVKSDDTLFCSSVDFTMNGELYVFQLLGDAHKWVDVAPVEPDCDDPGYTAGIQCEYCKKYKDGHKPEEIPALGHKKGQPVKENIKNPTSCAADGSYDEVVYCTVCGEELSRTKVTIPAPAHTPKAPVQENVVKETCTTSGSYDEVVYCSVCDKEISRVTTVVPATGHIFEDDGAGGLHCKVCGTVKIIKNPMEPDRISQELKDAGLTSVDQIKQQLLSKIPEDLYVGENMYEFCDVDMYVNVGDDQNPEWVLADKDHYPEGGKIQLRLDIPSSITDPSKFNFFVTHMVSTNDFGKEAGTIETFSAENGLVIENGKLVFTVTGLSPIILSWSCKTHDYDSAVTKPDCENEGYTTYTCKVCGHSYEDNRVPELGHNKDVYVPEKPATCEEAGHKEGYKCSRCDKWQEGGEVLEKLNHTWIRKDREDSSCNKVGHEAGIWCEEDAKWISGGEEIGKKPHTPGTPVVENKVDADACRQDGSYDEVIYCTVCGEEISRTNKVIAKDSHTPGTAAKENVVPATCTQGGTFDLVTRCTVCNEIITSVPGTEEKLGHMFSEGILADGNPQCRCGEIRITLNDFKDGDITTGLKGTYNTAADLKAKLHGDLTASLPAGTVLGDSMNAFYHAELWTKISDPNEWVKADNSVYPANGQVKVLLPIPAAVAQNASDFNFYVVRIAENNDFGNTVGTVEIFKEGSGLEIVDGKLVVTMTGMAPVYVAWSCKSHTPGTPVRENEQVGDCFTDTTYEEVVYCTVCGCEISRTPKADPAPGQHTPGTPVRENEVAPDACRQDGSYDEVIYCTACGGEISRTNKVIPAAPHTPEPIPGKPASETEEGWTEGVKCSICGHIITPTTPLAKLPKITPSVAVDPIAGAIRGAKVDESAKIIYLDAKIQGLKKSEFAGIVFQIDNESASSVTLKAPDGSVRAEDALVCNGDTVTVWATNVDNRTEEVTYSVIIMGDTNCDGKVNARDLSLADAYVVGLSTITGAALTATDMNFDGKINARDLAANDYKVLYWDSNTYVSKIQ